MHEKSLFDDEVPPPTLEWKKNCMTCILPKVIIFSKNFYCNILNIGDV